MRILGIQNISNKTLIYYIILCTQYIFYVATQLHYVVKH